MNRKEILELLKKEWDIADSINSITNNKTLLSRKINELKMTTEILLENSPDLRSDSCKDVFRSYIALRIPGYQMLEHFVQQYEMKTIDEILQDEILKDIVFSSIKKKSETIDSLELSSSKIKNKKDKTEKKSTTVDFDVFNTF